MKTTAPLGSGDETHHDRWTYRRRTLSAVSAAAAVAVSSRSAGLRLPFPWPSALPVPPLVGTEGIEALIALTLGLFFYRKGFSDLGRPTRKSIEVGTLSFLCTFGVVYVLGDPATVLRATLGVTGGGFLLFLTYVTESPLRAMFGQAGSPPLRSHTLPAREAGPPSVLWRNLDRRPSGFPGRLPVAPNDAFRGGGEVGTAAYSAPAYEDLPAGTTRVIRAIRNRLARDRFLDLSTFMREEEVDWDEMDVAIRFILSGGDVKAVLHPGGEQWLVLR